MRRVILEAMSPEVDSLLAQHNQEALAHLTAYVSSYVSNASDSLPAANQLPLSHFCYPLGLASNTSETMLEAQQEQQQQQQQQQQPRQSCEGSSESITSHGRGQAGQVTGALSQFKKQCRISSPFVALSGAAQLLLLQTARDCWPCDLLRLHKTCRCLDLQSRISTSMIHVPL